jgi:membrane protease YdiL (CAAX protease family)
LTKNYFSYILGKLEDFVEKTNEVKYKPLVFIVFVFIISWICAFLKEFVDLGSHSFLFSIIDFIESASPLIVAVILLKNYFKKRCNIFNFFIGRYHCWLNYLLVIIIFVLQLLNFYLFKIDDNNAVTLTGFCTMFFGQLFFAGGLEEAGWRGYLQPAFERRLHCILSVLIVGGIWMLWHIPYFFLPSLRMGSNFLIYSIIGIITAFILAAIYKLTGSVLLCSLFHGWQNTIVMTIPADQGHIGFQLFFFGLGIISIIICIFFGKRTKKWYVA